MSQRIRQKSKLKGRQAEDISIIEVRALIGLNQPFATAAIFSKRWYATRACRRSKC